MTSFSSDLTRQAIHCLQKEVNRKSTQKKIRNVVDIITAFAIMKLQPYLYAIIAILLIMFLMNCFQFYYYLKIVMLNKTQNMTM